MDVVIANDFDLRLYRRRDCRIWAQRVLWLTQPGDLVILPAAANAEFVEYVAEMRGIPASSFSILYPPPGVQGMRLLSGDRLRSDQFVQQVSKWLDGKAVKELRSLWPSTDAAQFASALGLADVMPGWRFQIEGGGSISNSKSTFRAFASGLGVPVADGFVCYDGPEMIHAIEHLYLEGKGWCLVKRSFDTAGSGNEVLSPVAPAKPISAGALSVTPVARSIQAIEEYVRERWDWASQGSRDPVVVERFIEDGRSVYVETDIRESEIVVNGTGEMFYNPAPDFQAVPLIVEPSVWKLLFNGAMRLSQLLQSIGYRGHASCDALVAPDGSVVFTEVNSQITGSTHIHDGIAQRVVARHTSGPRLIVERAWRQSWAVPSFAEMRRLLVANNLVFNAAKAEGVILTLPYDPATESAPYCIVARDQADIREIEVQIDDLVRRPVT